MPFSHHSHSGQFCPGHAVNTLEEMIQTAIARGMTTFGLSEHMPRDEIDFYPEEIEGHSTAQALVDMIDGFYDTAVQLRKKYEDKISILIGFESDWIRPSSVQLIKTLQAKHDFDYFVGSVHHVYTIPIDFDKPKYQEARKLVGGSDEELFAAYFDAQHSMLKKLKPPVVGHFDLIRLFSDEPNGSFKRFDGVWAQIVKNLEIIASYGGLVELNSSALRKGMDEPYPKVEICEAFLALGGKFTLSDDSHGITQVGLNYHRVLDAIRQAGIQELHYLKPRTDTKVVNGNGPVHASIASISLADFEAHQFWTTESTT